LIDAFPKELELVSAKNGKIAPLWVIAQNPVEISLPPLKIKGTMEVGFSFTT